MDNLTTAQAMRTLQRARPALTLQQTRTLRGQILAGDISGAMRGLERLLAERRRKHG